MALTHRVEFYVPSRCSCTEPVDGSLRNRALEMVKETLAGWFGGSTETSARGVWMSDTHGIVQEDVTIVYSNADDSALEENRDGIDRLAGELASLLGQEAVAVRIDYILDFYGESQPVCVHRRQVRTAAGAIARRRARAFAVACDLKQLGDAESVGNLFTGVLGFDPEQRLLDVSEWSREARELLLPEPGPRVVAAKHGCDVLFLPLRADDITKREMRTVAESLRRSEAGDPSERRDVLVLRNAPGTQWVIVSPRYASQDRSRRLVLRHASIDPQLRSLSGIRRLLMLECSDAATAEEVCRRIDSAFDAKGLTAEFFREYERVFALVRDSVTGLESDEQRHLFTQNLLNRLMFVAFLEKKGWLRLGESTAYLNALWEDYCASQSPEGSFYRTRLQPLFFEGLNTPVEARRPETAVLGDIPYLNGGLFSRSSGLDDRGDVPDGSIRMILEDLFRPFDFTVAEDTPLDQEAAVDPNMLGHVFERLVIGRHEKGSYYTPSEIVSFMCRQALKLYLARSVPEESEEGIRRLVDERNPSSLASPEGIIHALEHVTVCDPACGSGAYLVGMMQEIVDLLQCLTAGVAGSAESGYRRKLRIIQNNLYGVDIDPVAVNLARLRLWLALAVEFQGEVPPPLPNLDFKIELGDSLTGPAPADAVCQDIFRHHDLRQLRELKARFLRPRSGSEHEDLRRQIEELEQSIADWVHPGEETDGFDWQVRFAEVFLRPVEQEIADPEDLPGFDIVLTNPPYVRHGLIPARVKRLLQRRFPHVHDGAADLYVYFYARAIELLKPGGVLAFISSNKWFRAGYGRKLRSFVARECAIQSITDFGELPVFESAATFPMVFIALRKQCAEQTPLFTQIRSLEPPYPDVLELVRRDGRRLPPAAIQEDCWTLTDLETIQTLRQMETGTLPLGAYVDGQIYYGIKTGFNTAFFIDGSKRAELIAEDPASEEIIRPLAVGDDIRKWQIRDRDRWLILTRIGVDIARYPAVFAHLRGWQRQLEKRYDKGDYWWELRACDYYEAFDRPKILYPVIAMEPRFAYDRDGCFTNDKAFIIPVDDLFLLGLLNSRPVWEYLKARCSVLGDPGHRGRLELRAIYVQNIPVPAASPGDRKAIEELAQKCVDAKGENCEQWEREIDDRVARLYGL